MPRFMIVFILYINLLNQSSIKMSIFEEYGAFKLMQVRLWKNKSFKTSLGFDICLGFDRFALGIRT